MNDFPKPEESDFFALLELPVRFDLNKREIKQASFKKLLIFHPDRFIESNVLNKRQALQSTSLINRAVAVLLDPITRAEHMLFLNGIEIASYEQKVPASLLMFFLEFQEELEKAESDDKKKRLMLDIQELLLSNCKDLELAFAQENFEEAAFLCIKRRFLYRLQESLNRRL